MAKEWSIETPRGRVILVGNCKARLEWNPNFAPKHRAAFSRRQKYVDSSCLRYMDPLTPFRTGMLKLSAKLGTVLGSGIIRYLAIYARRQYYTHKTKAKWFETMKARNKEQILKGAAKIQ